jgi:predicted small metal-binding protein
MMKDNVHEFRADRHAGGGTQQNQPYEFRCADVGYECDFKTTGTSEEEVMQHIEEHGREAHNMQTLSDQKKYKLRNNIRRAA